MALPVLNVIGDIKNHDQVAYRVVTGKCDFSVDRLPGQKFYGAIKLSTIANGSIKSIDSTKALAEPGVKGVITYKDCPSWRQGIFQWGQEVAAVVADDPATARRAATLIDVVYDVGVAVIDPDEAMKTGSALAGIRPDTNIANVGTVTRGDVAAGMVKADVVLDTTFGYSTSYSHNCSEPHSAIAWWVGDDVHFWETTQDIHGARAGFVNTMGMAATKVHAFNHFTGTGHGDKTGAFLAAPAALLSKLFVNGAPVQIVNTRKENILCYTRQFATRSAIKLGAKKDGTLTAVDAQFYSDAGRNAGAPQAGIPFGLRTTYTIPDAKFNVVSIVTNTPQRGYWRCVNDPPGAVNYDSALDKLAEKLDMNPYDLRMKNIRPLDAPDLDAPYNIWGNGGAGGGVKMCFEKVYSESGYASKWHKPNTRTLADGRMHGIAITGHLDSHGAVMGLSRGGIVIMTPDGKCQVNVGGVRACEGGPTVCVHVVAEVLGMNYADVCLGEWGVTDVSLTAGMQAGSGFTGGAGSAFYNTAMDLRKQLFAYAITKAGLKEIVGITVADLDAKNSEVFYTKDPTKKLTYRQVMAGTPPTAGRGNGWNAGTTAPGQGLQRERAGKLVGTGVNTNGGAAACVEVAVDLETGEVEVTGMWNAVDTGRTIFKTGAIKEMNSGCELIVSQAFFMGDMYDWLTGALIGTQFTESQMPTTMDMKTEKFNVYDIESDDYAGPFGAHGIGEPCVTNYSAIFNAIFNATGKWVDPDKGAVTPAKVLKALGKA